MRNELIKHIKRCFGPTYGSRELKELRTEIIDNVLQRYDDEVKGGEGAIKAYSSAADSLGDIKAMLASMKIPEKQRTRGLAITLPVFALMSAAIIWAGFSSGVTKSGVLFVIFGLIAVGLLAAGVISLICGFRKKALSILMIAIGCYILLPVTYLTMLIGADASSSRDFSYDLAAEIGNISSIEYVKIDGLTYENTRLYESGLDYTVLWSVGIEKWPSLLERLAELEYHIPANAPPGLYTGNEMFLITYVYPRDGVTFVLIGNSCPGYGRRVDSRIVFDYKGAWCDNSAWKKIIADFK